MRELDSLRSLLGCGAAALLLFLAGCSSSKYQSFADGGFGEQVASRLQWEVALPYESSRALSIEEASGKDLLLSDKQGQFHLTKIPLMAEGKPGRLLHLQVPDGDSCDRAGPGLLVVTGDKGKRKCVTLVDAETLTARFSTTLAFQENSDISVPGRKQVGNTLIFFRSNVKIDRYHDSDGTYEWQTPYVANSVYDIHLVDLATKVVHSFAAIASDSMAPLKERLTESAAEIKVSSSLRTPGLPADSTGRKVDSAIYLLDQFFLVDQGRILIFSLANLKDEKLYFSVDVQRGASSIEWHAAGELVRRYPDELVSTPREPKEKLDQAKSMGLEISGKSYAPDHFSTLQGGIVMVGRVKLGTDQYVPNRYLVGIRLGAAGVSGLQRSWEYKLRHELNIGPAIEDEEGSVVYVPDSNEKGSYRLLGLRAADGRQVEGFPANFSVDGDDDKRTVQVVGTAADFERNHLYLHDVAKNRVICAVLRPGVH